MDDQAHFIERLIVGQANHHIERITGHNGKDGAIRAVNFNRSHLRRYYIYLGVGTAGTDTRAYRSKY